MAIATRPQTAEDVRAAICAARFGPVRDVTDAFHTAWYNTRHTWGMTYWQRIPTLKNPLDLWMVQEIIVGFKPALIIETGTAFGGSALFMAQMMELSQCGSVVTIDIDPPRPAPSHPRLMALVGSSLDPSIIEVVGRLAGKFGRGPVLVMLDSAHDAPHVRAEMEVYAPFVTHGSYLIVEDTNVNGHPAHPEHGPGPFEAVQDFLATHDEFTPDPFCEKYLLTMHPGGWLRRAS
jgi:cephalosporin hydroxylase